MSRVLAPSRGKCRIFCDLGSCQLLASLDAIALFTNDSGKESHYNRMEDTIFVVKLALFGRSLRHICGVEKFETWSSQMTIVWGLYANHLTSKLFVTQLNPTTN
jgi:hypothetical protein